MYSRLHTAHTHKQENLGKWAMITKNLENQQNSCFWTTLDSSWGFVHTFTSLAFLFNFISFSFCFTEKLVSLLVFSKRRTGIFSLRVHLVSMKTVDAWNFDIFLGFTSWSQSQGIYVTFFISKKEWTRFWFHLSHIKKMKTWTFWKEFH